MIKSEKKINNEKQQLLFYLILNQRGKVSEISGDKLRGEINSLWFHHILPKSSYPKLRYLPENIIVVTAQEHFNIEQGKLIYEEVEKRKEDLLLNCEHYISEAELYLNTYLNPLYDYTRKKNYFNDEKPSKSGPTVQSHKQYEAEPETQEKGPSRLNQEEHSVPRDDCRGD